MASERVFYRREVLTLCAGGFLSFSGANALVAQAKGPPTLVGRTTEDLIGATAGLDVVLTDAFIYPAQMKSGWQASVEIDGKTPRISKVTGRPYLHHGLDWVGPEGLPVIANVTGKVIGAYDGQDSLYGKFTAIGFGPDLYNGDRWVSVGQHYKKVLVKAGDQVKAGDVIGLMGNTGTPVGVHWHNHIERGQSIKSRQTKGRHEFYVAGHAGYQSQRFNPLNVIYDVDPNTPKIEMAVVTKKSPHQYAEAAKDRSIYPFFAQERRS